MTHDAELVEGYTVSEAAKRLGISKNAIRKRVQRESLPATKVDGEWRIFLQDEVSGDEESDDDTGQDVSQEVALDLARQQLETFRDAFVMPLVERVGELEHENGRLESDNKHLTDRADRLAGENEELRRRLEDAEGTPDRSELEEIIQGVLRSRDEEHKPWWKWW